MDFYLHTFCLWYLIQSQVFRVYSILFWEGDRQMYSMLNVFSNSVAALTGALGVINILNLCINMSPIVSKDVFVFHLLVYTYNTLCQSVQLWNYIWRQSFLFLLQDCPLYLTPVPLPKGSFVTPASCAWCSWLWNDWSSVWSSTQRLCSES